MRKRRFHVLGASVAFAVAPILGPSAPAWSADKALPAADTPEARKPIGQGKYLEASVSGSEVSLLLSALHVWTGPGIEEPSHHDTRQEVIAGFHPSTRTRGATIDDASGQNGGMR